MQNKVALCHCAGTSCTDFRILGQGAREQGITFAHLLIWAAQRKLLQEPIIVQENVTTFPLLLLTELLPEWEWTAGILSPADLGWPIRRDRQWAV